MMEIPMYRRGEWGTVSDPTGDGGGGDYERLMNAAGYTRLTRVGPVPGDVPGDGGDSGISLEVWGGGADPSRPDRRPVEGAPTYLIDIELHETGHIQTVAAQDIADLMDLLAKWAPVVRED